MAKRISDIAKDLGVQSKAIIDKCKAEGVPADKVKNHMSTVSAGLELSIREWFASTPSGTAVETTTHVDAEHVRAAPAPKKTTRAKTKSADTPEGEDGGGVATEAPPSKPRRTGTKAHPTTETSAPTEGASETIVARTATPVAPEQVSAPAPAPAPAAPAPVSAPPKPAPAKLAPTPIKLAPTGVQPPAPAQAPANDGGTEPPTKATRAAASAPAAPPAPPTPGQGHGPTHGPGHGPAGGPPRTTTPIRPAPMNVPNRPTTVKPVGPMLQERTAVKLTGPKVVRIEAPDLVDRPKPRRDAGGFAGGPSRPGGGGYSPGTGVGDDRSKRRTTGAGGGDAARGVPPRRRGLSGDKDMHSGMWRPQDLAEREARLSRSTGYLKQRRQAARKLGTHTGERATTPADSGGQVRIAEPFTIKDLSAATGVKASDIIKKLFMQGVMASVNSGIDSVKAQEIMADYDIELIVAESKTAEEAVSEKFTKREMVEQRSRGPIVTILGHVDHGKTSLLDKIRNANVAAGEAGGITQATSAFRVPLKISGEEKHVVFLDTPGHEAFTSMRARGAQITDIVVLVVSAPEGVMPQTIESINHAKAAKVPIVVALNKIDRPDATDARINQTLGELAAQGLNPVEWGGETEVVRTSATKGTGVEQLLEILDLQGQVLDLKADFGGPARGTVVEARRQEGRGAVANVIVQDGQLDLGDFIVLGPAFGKVRDIVDDRGQRHKSAGPGMVVQISGFDEIPNAGDKFYVVDSLKEAQDAAEQRRMRVRDAQLSMPKVTLDSLLSQMKDADVKEILIVLKADVQGSVDVLRNEIERVKTDEVKARVLHAAVGGITESDVMLAEASKAVVIGFNVIASNKARVLAEQKSVEIRTYQVIYEITDDIKKAAEGLLAPERKTQILGHAEVRRVFKISKVGSVAGCFVTDGVVERDALIRVTRNGVVIENDRKLEQLKRVKDDAKEVRAGMECGMKIVGYDDIKEGDVLECYKNVEVKRTLGG